MKEFKSGTVSIIGKPNTGKSTLINLITDRRYLQLVISQIQLEIKFLEYITEIDSQILFFDTPGYQKSNKFLNRIMIQSSMQAIGEGDIILLLLLMLLKRYCPKTMNLFRKIEGKNSIVAINKKLI